MFRSLRLVLIGLAGALAINRPARSQDILIHEIMYQPAGTNHLEEWFELLNPTPQPVDLSAWRVTQGVSLVLPSRTILAPGNYLVIAADAAAFAARYPGVTNVVAGWSGTLSSKGEAITLEDAQGRVVDTVSYASEGDWGLRRMGAPDRLGRQGWEWFAEHAGLGKSLELINAGLPNSWGQNWGSSRVTGGTPGHANSIGLNNIAPMITEVGHAPVVPRSSEAVRITARLTDEHTQGMTAMLHWRRDGTAFNVMPMSDDGAHGDGLGNDGIFGAILGPQAGGTVIEFYLTAQDAENNSRKYPNTEPGVGGRSANLAYQVDDSAYSGDLPIHRLVMPPAEYHYLTNEIWNDEPNSDALVNGTFINTDGVLDNGTSSQVRYLCGFRNRGHGTRTSVPHNFHVDLPGDQGWKGRRGINLNTHYTHSQVLGSAVFRRLGLPMADSRPVQVRVNGANLAKPGQEQFGVYAANEVMDDRLVKQQFPLDDQGNLYRGIRDLIPGIDSEADLSWHGSSHSSYTNAYVKENNSAANDWSDFIHLLDVLNREPDATYVRALESVANVDAWMKYFAINTLFDNQENSLGIGEGDDFALYRGTNDTRFLLLPYDMDAVMGRGLRTTTFGDGIWRMTKLPVIDRLMKRPEFVPLYFKHLQQLGETTFSAAQMNPLLDQLLGSHVDASTLAALKAFNSDHVAHVLSQFPRGLTRVHDLPVISGYPRTTLPTLSLSGKANAIETRRVLINGNDALWIAWQGVWTNHSVGLHPGLNRLLVQALGEGNHEVERGTLDVWYDDGSVQSAGGTISGSTVWTEAAGPYDVTANLTVAANATLTIEPGTTVYLGPGVNLVVAAGGRLVAEGTDAAPIRFATRPGVAASWGSFIIHGDGSAPEIRIAHAHFEGNGTTCIEVDAGTLYLDHATFGTTSHPYVSLDGSSFLISHCHFPAATAAFELLHGTRGIKPGGRGIVRDSYFGSSMGYSDIVDFTGGNRPGQPIIQFYNNVFVGSTDDILDLDGTDAWVEGNIFLHVHRNGAPDSSAAISGGSNGGSTSEVTILGNLFFDCDNAVTAKQGNSYTLINNSILHTTRTGGVDFDSGVINVRDTTPDLTTYGRGVYVEGNIIVDAEQLVRNYDPLETTVTFVNNLLPLPWSGPGQGNKMTDPLLVQVPTVSETIFGTWQEAQVMREWLALQPGSPARKAGSNGRDLGGVIPMGVSVFGEPSDITSQTQATLTVGFNRTGSGVPAAGFPDGSGFTHYKARLDGGDWSEETPLTTPITLTALSNGRHWVEVIGKNDAGWFQNDPDLGMNSVITTSRVWTVDTNHVAPPAPPTVRINEVLAANTRFVTTRDMTPDLIELYNYGTEPVELSGFGLTDNPDSPFKFAFASNTVLPAGGFLIVCADDPNSAPYPCTGFKLNQEGDEVLLFDTPTHGGGLLDSIRFGLQVPDLSIGRGPDGVWVPGDPTFGTDNLPQPTGDPRSLRINEWLADAQFVARNDFVELYNPDQLPVALGGLFLSDAAGSLWRHPIAALSFIAGNGYAEFIADNDPNQGADHLSFKLSPDVGLIVLSSSDLVQIDAVSYGAQRTDVAEGRSPNGADTFARFTQPTGGSGNPGPIPGDCVLTTTTANLVPMGEAWSYNQTENLDGTGWYLRDYNDSTWRSGPALLAVESSTLPEPGKLTTLNLGRITYYFRTRFLAPTNLDGFSLNLKMVVDDGAVLYLNGTRLLSQGLSTDTPNYSTFASRNVDNATTEFFTVPASALVQGTNVLAAEVHQANSASSDVVWGLGVDASYRSTNCGPNSVATLALNEVLATGRTVTNVSDFVEIYNTGTNVLDMVDISLTDDSRFSSKWAFLPGTMIQPGGYYIVYCDATRPSSTNNTGFGLGALGGTVLLFNKANSGGSLIDSVQYGLQTPGFSIGRIPAGTGTWNLAVLTPGSANVAAGLASVSTLKINEWMADPAHGGDWLEIYNPASQPVALGGLYLTDNLAEELASPVAPLSFIGTGPLGFVQFIADGDVGAGADHVAFSLKKSGEALGIFSPAGQMLDGLTFGAQTTDVSEGRFPDGAPGRVSFATTASPAGPNYLPLSDALINEVLSHADPPLEDAIELYNPTDADVDVGGWYLSNDRENLRRFRFPDATVLPAKGFLVLYEADFNQGPDAFTFNSAAGAKAILSQADAAGDLSGYRDEVQFGAAESGVSFGRVITSHGVDFTALQARSFGEDAPLTVEEFRTGSGLPNAGPKVGPLVINEIMYYSATGGLEPPEDEYLELQNISGNPLSLFDTSSTDHTWSVRDAVEFNFPSNFTIPPGGRVLLVGFPPADAGLLAAFRIRFNVPSEVPVVGPWNGRLGNDGDRVELVKPGVMQMPPHPDAGLVPLILIDKVLYSSLAPWPSKAAEGTWSLQRVSLPAYGNDPVNWHAAAPTAGRENLEGDADTDGDGMDDGWEYAYFGNLFRDGTGDFDADGMKDIQEYLSGTNPVDASDLLEILPVTEPRPGTFQFRGVAGRTYSVQYRDSLATDTWHGLIDIPPRPVSGPVSVVDPTLAVEERFYRVVTPAEVP